MVDILAFGAHPDDVELGCGGILAKAAAEGKSIVIVDLTAGDKGSNGTPEQRMQEGVNAAKLIGAERRFLHFSDCETIDTYEGRLELVKVIRKYKPRLVIAPLWKGEQNHPDHLACGAMARYACRYARFKNILPELPVHTPEGILHYLHPFHGNPDFLIDVSDYIEIWEKMVLSHTSQMNTKPYMDWAFRETSSWGVMIGKSHAQGLIKGNPVEIDDIMSVSKGSFEI